jgi:hypothetical protein
MRLRLALVLAAAALAAGALAGAAASGATISSRAGVANREADDLFASLRLPPGATASPTAPAGTGGLLDAPPASTSAPTVTVYRHEWWVEPGRPGDVLAYVRAHPPAGAKVTTTGASAEPGHRATFVGYERPATRVLSMRTLYVEVTKAGGGQTGVRADAEVVWIVPRPAWEHVHGARSVKLALPGHHAVIAEPAKVRRIERLVNGLPRVQPGAVNCPSGLLTGRAHLVFRDAAGRPFARSLVDPGGCGIVTLRIHRRRGPPLDGGAELYHRLAALVP